MTRRMKDSGIEWIGDIPKKWKVVKLSNIFKERKVKNKGNIETNVLSLSYGSIKKRNVETNMGLLPANFETYNIIENGNIVLRLTDLQNDHKSLRCGLVNERGIITSAYVTLEKTVDIDSNYYYRLLHTFDIMKGFYGMGEGVRQSLKFDGELKRLLLVMPCVNEQKQIADYLDKKCTKIEQTIEKEKQLIEKLKEYKQSVITEAVTKGLNPNVKMKDSGVEWIGEIPEHWKAIKVKHMCNLNGRIGWQGLTSAEYKEEGPYLITGTDFKNGRIDWNTCVHITEERYEEAKQIQIRNGDLLITKDGTIGKVAIVSSLDGKASLNSGVLLIRPIKRDLYIIKFMYYVLLSQVFWMWFESTKTGNSTIIHLYQEKFKEFSYALPLLEEQKQIADYLDKKCSSIDKLISNKEKLIEKLTEYKKSLIYECVTGKREIR